MACKSNFSVTDPVLLAKIADGQIHYPDDPRRYKYVVELLIIILVIYLLKPKALRPHLDRIKWKGLLIYIVVVIVLFNVLMKIGLTNNQWDIAHFCAYFGISYFVPDCIAVIAVLEVCWELFEDYQGFDKKKPVYVETDVKKMVDIVANTSGYFIGNLIFNHRNMNFVDGM